MALSDADHTLLATNVGALRLRTAVMTASGTSGHGAELSAYGSLADLGGVVVKSLAANSWPGNEGVRVRGLCDGSMLNRVGLQGAGVAAWRAQDLPVLRALGTTVVASIWGRTAAEFAAAAEALVVTQDGAARDQSVVAVEVNVSCPNLSGHMFAHSEGATAEVVRAVAEVLGPAGVPLWTKLSPGVADICAIADAALGAGADGLTLVNTMPAMWVDVERREAPFAGGLSGPALHPIAVRAVHDCRRAFPSVPILGVGGVATGNDAAELLVAGANAVQVGTATFADPRAPWRVQDELARLCARRATTVEELSRAAFC